MLADGYHDLPAGKIAAVVTYLEMHAPQLRGAPCPDGLCLRELTRDTELYRDLFRRIGAPWLWFGRLGLNDDALREILDDRLVLLYTLEKRGQAEALLELDFRTQGQCELAYFGLTPALIGQGAGAYLMDQAQKIAFTDETTRFFVHTCTLDSPQALGFYVRSGFSPYKRQIEIADDPRQSGILSKHTRPDLPVL